MSIAIRSAPSSRPDSDRVGVATGAGLLVGRRLAGGRVDAFLGVPYAAAPVGPLRWRPPQPLPVADSECDATAFRADLPQQPNRLLRGAGQSEDCLHLNVWTPVERPAAAAGMPVLVWLHGGGFVGGSGSDLRCDGERLAGDGVVVVTINYRSGVFGFLAHPGLSRESADGVSGNYGLLDQIAALHWIRRHIGAFGGDAERITLFGVSAGSASIALLLTAPAARGLFRQVILHSPGTCRPLADLATAEAAGCSLGTDIEVLRRLPTDALFALTGRLVPAMRGLTTPRVLRPIRDGVLIPGDELPAFDNGDFAHVRMLVGTNLDEGSKLTAGWTVDSVPAYHHLLAQTFAGAAETAQRLYPVTPAHGVRERVAELFADTQFNYGAWRVAAAMAAHRPVWRYLFRRRPPGMADGPHHGDEVGYVFGNLDRLAAAGGPRYDADDEAVSRAMRDAWVRFAVYGDPDGKPDGNPDGNPDDDREGAPRANPDGGRDGERYGGRGGGRGGEGPAAFGRPGWPRFEPARSPVLAFDAPLGRADGWRQSQIDFIDAFLHRTDAGDPAAAQRLVDQFAALLADADAAVLAALLAPDVALRRLGFRAQGVDAVLAALRGADLYRRVDWQPSRAVGADVRLTGLARDPATDPGLVLTIATGAGRITRIDQQRVPPKPPPASALVLPAALRALIDDALASRHPMLLACCDPQGQPLLSFRGSVQVFGDDGLSLWVRNRSGQFLAAIRHNPRVALVYRNEDTKATYQFQGRAREVDDPVIAGQIHRGAPEVERDHDFARLGVAVVIELDRVEGYAGLGPAGQIDRLLLVRD